MRRAVFLLLLLTAAVPAAAATPEGAVRGVIQKFQDALQDRNVAHVERVVARDLVAFENGHRNDGWEDFRDNLLIPDFAHPLPAHKWELVRVSASADLAWAYTRTLFSYTRKGQRIEGVLWTVFVLERRGPEWKIVLVDWNRGKPQVAGPAPRSRR